MTRPRPGETWVLKSDAHQPVDNNMVIAYIISCDAIIVRYHFLYDHGMSGGSPSVMTVDKFVSIYERIHLS